MSGPKHERYISPVPKGGFLVRVTRQSGTRYAPTLAAAIARRAEIFQELFGEPYSEEAANRIPYATNKSSDRRGIQLVRLKNGKQFWQVKYIDSATGRTRIQKFFVSRWGHEEGYRRALAVKSSHEPKADDPNNGNQRTSEQT